MDKFYKFANCRLLKNHTISDEALFVHNGKVVNPQHYFYTLKKKPDYVIDMKGNIISPGFIDIQINGGFGYDFTHDLRAKHEALDIVAKRLLEHGVTSFCPTIVTTTPDNYRQLLKMIAPRKGGPQGAEILGVHLEGPFINKEKKGAHERVHIKEPTGVSSLAEVYGDLSNVKLVTLAPELEKSNMIIKWLAEKNITVCLGHSDATVEEAEEGLQFGAKIITHLFNAMRSFHHRNPGLIALLASNRPVYYGLIADGVHAHPYAIKVAFQTNPKGVILVTDAISAMGFEEGIHHIGGRQIEIRGGSAYVIGTSTLCGSIATMNKCVKFFKESTGCSMAQALEAASLHPALALGLDKNIGTLGIGARADFVVLNDEFEVLSTWIEGECVYDKNKQYIAYTKKK